MGTRVGRDSLGREKGKRSYLPQEVELQGRERCKYFWRHLQNGIASSKKNSVVQNSRYSTPTQQKQNKHPPLCDLACSLLPNLYFTFSLHPQ